MIEKISKKLKLDALKSIAPTEYAKSYVPLIVISAVVFVIGVIFGLTAFVKGHHEVFNVTRTVPLGILLSTYIFFVVSSTGCCLLIPFTVHIFGYKTFEPFIKRMVALALFTIFSGFLVLLFELEHPIKMMWNYITPNLRSNIWWMGTFYCLYILFMAAEFVCLLLRKTKYSVVLGFFGGGFGIAAHSNLGGVFATLIARPYWHGPLMPIYFIISALVTGAALTIFFTYISYKLRKKEFDEKIKNAMFSIGKFFAVALAILLFFYVWEVIVGIFCTPHGKFEVTMALLAGPLKYNFWIFEVGLGLLVPLFTTLAVLLFTRARSITTLFVAAISCIVGIFIMRYDLVVAGQIVPVWHSIEAAGYDCYATYAPSLFEIGITAGGFGLCMFLYLMAERFLGLDWFTNKELKEVAEQEDKAIALAEDVKAEKRAQLKGPWKLEAGVKPYESRVFKLDKARKVLEESVKE